MVDCFFLEVQKDLSYSPLRQQEVLITQPIFQISEVKV
jgi:hypothetical protein